MTQPTIDELQQKRFLEDERKKNMCFTYQI